LQTFFQSSFLDHHLVVQGKWQFLIQKMFWYVQLHAKRLSWPEAIFLLDISVVKEHLKRTQVRVETCGANKV
jgi:hypothetical protein